MGTIWNFLPGMDCCLKRQQALWPERVPPGEPGGAAVDRRTLRDVGVGAIPVTRGKRRGDLGQCFLTFSSRQRLAT